MLFLHYLFMKHHPCRWLHTNSRCAVRHLFCRFRLLSMQIVRKILLIWLFLCVMFELTLWSMKRRILVCCSIPFITCYRLRVSRRCCCYCRFHIYGFPFRFGHGDFLRVFFVYNVCSFVFGWLDWRFHC